MSYRDTYLKRFGENDSDIGDGFKNNSDYFMENAFSSSPTYRLMTVEGRKYPKDMKIDGRTIEVERMGALREILFKPSSEGVVVGTYLGFDNEKWLAFDKFGQNKVLVEKCNRKLRWYDKNGINHEIECIASASDLGSKAKQSKNELEFNKFDVRLPLGQLFVFVELTDETAEIGLNDRFLFGKKAYEVTGIDDTSSVDRDGYGLLQLTVKITPIREEDDFVKQVAHNVYRDTTKVTPSEEEFVEPEKEEQEGGGLIW